MKTINSNSMRTYYFIFIILICCIQSFGKEADLIQKSLVSGNLSKYVNQQTQLYVCKDLSDEMKDILSEGEKIYTLILSRNQPDKNHQEIRNKLNNNLKTLMIDQPSSCFERYKGRVFSTDSSLVRKVDFILHSVELENLEDAVKNLNYLLVDWSKKLSSHTSSSLSKNDRLLMNVNQRYLKILKKFHKNLNEIYLEYNKIMLTKKELEDKALSDFQVYDSQKKPALARYLEEIKSETITITQNQSFLTNEKISSRSSLILVLEIGLRKLYFDVTKRSDNHPFYLL